MSNSNADLLRVQLRWMTERDLDSVYNLEQNCSEKPWGPMEFAEVLMRSSCVGMVVEYQSQIIGYLIYETCENAISIMNVAVLPKFRRKGVGSQMIARLACRLTRGVRNCMTLDVCESNLSAQLFFRSLGFKAVRISRASGNQPEDMYCMQYRQHSRILPTALVLN